MTLASTQVALAIAHAYGLQAIVDVVLDQTVKTLGAHFAYVLLADERRGELKLVGQRNLPKEIGRQLRDVPFDAPLLAAQAASTLQTQVRHVQEIDDADLGLTRDILLRMGCETAIALPLIAREQLVGVQTFDLVGHHEFTAPERSSLETCAEIFAFGIWNAMKHEEERRIRSLFEAVGAAASGIADELELKHVLQKIVDEACRVTDAKYGGLGIAISPDRPFEPWVFSGITKQEEEHIGRHPRPVGTLGIVAWDDRPIRVPDVKQLSAFRGFPPHHPSMSSLLGVPIRYKGRSVGNLYLANKRNAVEFGEEDERAVALLAAHAGAAVHLAMLREELETQRARFMGIVENAPYGAVFVDAATRKIIANRRAVEIGGQEDVARLGDYRGQVRTPGGELIPEDQTMTRRVLEGGTFETRELIIRRPDGRDVPVLASAAPVFKRDGTVDGAVVAFEDISKLKELQRMREEWASIVSHDLRQPLNVIMLNTGLLRDMAHGHDPQQLLGSLGQTEKAVNTLNRMISDLADASHLDTHRLEIRKRRVQLDELARDSVERQRTVAPDRALVLNTTGPIPPVEADPVRIEQVLANLLSNALKYSDPDTAVRVDVGPVADEVRVRVSNRGPAIPPADLPKLFDRYYRSQRVRPGPQAGLGLGLYIAKGLIEAHGGRIWAESAASGTTIFQFALPVARRTDP